MRSNPSEFFDKPSVAAELDKKLESWNKLHGVRSVLLTTAFAMVVAASVVD
jgi:hypothetical protein